MQSNRTIVHPFEDAWESGDPSLAPAPRTRQTMKIMLERRGALRCSRFYVEISLFESSEFGIVQDSIASWGEYLDSEDWVKTEKPQVPDILKQEQVESLASALQIINIAPSTEPDERVVDGWSTDLTISHGLSTIRLH